MRKNSIKHNRISQEVKRELGQIIEMELKDPRIKPMTSVVYVDLTPDLKSAKVYVSVFGDKEDKDNTIEGLQSAASYIRGLLAKNINLRFTPELNFILDESIEYGVNMSKYIDEVTSQDKQNEITED